VWVRVPPPLLTEGVDIRDESGECDEAPVSWLSPFICDRTATCHCHAFSIALTACTRLQVSSVMEIVAYSAFQIESAAARSGRRSSWCTKFPLEPPEA
jgi:hypothetical protein